MNKEFHIVFHEQELLLMKEVYKFLRQAKYELQGDEILAGAQILKWVENLPKRAVPYEIPKAVESPKEPEKKVAKKKG